MNAEISIYLDLDGDRTVIESLMADVTDIVLNHGLANLDDPDSPVRSLILFKLLEDDFDVQEELDKSYYAVVPTKGEENEQS